MEKNTVTAQEVIDLVRTLPPDRLAIVYEFALSIRQHLPTSEPEDGGVGGSAEEIRAADEQPDREYQTLPDQPKAVARDSVAGYRVGRSSAVDIAAFALASEGAHKPRPVNVRALPGYKLWLRYSDGVEGEADLSHLVGKGVFSTWNDCTTFQKVYIGKHGEIAWGEEIDLCPDSLYMKITGFTPEEMFPSLRAETVDA